MIRTIPLHQIQYKDKYKKILEIKKKNKNIETKKDCKKVKGNSQSLKYSNVTFTNKKYNDKSKINFIKKLGQTEYKNNAQNIININNNYNDKYKKYILFINNQESKNKKLYSIRNTQNTNNNNNTEVKNNQINNEVSKVSDFSLKEKYSYSCSKKVKYLNNKIKKNISIVNISNSSIENNSSIQYKSSQKLNLSYSDFIKDFKSKLDDETKLKKKKQKNYIPYLKKFMNKNDNTISYILKISNEIKLEIKSSFNKKEKLLENCENKNNDLINIKKELEIKENKIKELSEKINFQNNEYTILSINNSILFFNK